MTKPPEGSTYLDVARAEEMLLASGRFKDEVAAKVPTLPNYPKQPENSPWSNDPVGQEPPLGFKIDQMSEGDDG
jgi:hypothetical protein